MGLKTASRNSSVISNEAEEDTDNIIMYMIWCGLNKGRREVEVTIRSIF